MRGNSRTWRPTRAPTRHAAAALALLLMAAPALGSSVAPLNLQELADLAAQVIVGRVVTSESGWVASPRRIETRLTFADVEVLKGPPVAAGENLLLTVPGGTVGSVSERLTGAPLLEPDQTWVLFILPEYRTHPVAGLAQGAFRVQADEQGILRVIDATGRPLVGFDADGYPEVAPQTGHAAAAHLRAQRGARVRPPASASRAGLALDEFRARLAPVLAASRAHSLTGPAGQRVLVKHRSVPLRVSAPADSRRDLP